MRRKIHCLLAALAITFPLSRSHLQDPYKVGLRPSNPRYEQEAKFLITPNIVCKLRLLLTVVFCWTSSPLISQDQPRQNQQAENLPESEFRILHADDFQGEISPTITVTQGVTIKEGTVSLPGKSRLTHRFNKQSQATFDFNF
ncbi:MAG: hypothetical protein VYB72_05160, partial [Planctomycetota bacterium]|nr:hypothetical protein [Planctomycetota bacterium]